MLELVTTGQFRKDFKRVKKRGYDMKLLEDVIDLLLNEQPLAERYRDHSLSGNYAGFREQVLIIMGTCIFNCQKKMHFFLIIKILCKDVQFVARNHMLLYRCTRKCVRAYTF